MEEQNVKELSKTFSKKQLIELLDGTIKNHTELVKWLYDNHKDILREYEKTKGDLRIEFLGGNKDEN